MHGWNLPLCLHTYIVFSIILTLYHSGGEDDQLYSRLDQMSTEVQTPVDQLYAQVDKKKKGKKKSKEDNDPTTSPQTPDAQVDEVTSSPETAQKSTEKELQVCPEESGAVYSVVNKPSPPQLPTKSQQLLEEVRP